MNTEFYQAIEKGTAHRFSRDANRDLVLAHPEYLGDLVAIACNPKDKIHYKALWVIELLSVKKPELLVPFVNQFCLALPKYTIERAIRPSAKICFQLVHSKKVTLTEAQEERLIETCLDWLVNNVKVAPAAFALRSLYLLGLQHPWVHDELRLLLSKTVVHPTPGYKVVVKELLKRLN
ncbi:MAG: hypothetical protein RL427_1445 [Bacteroidota bacterium]